MCITSLSPLILGCEACEFHFCTVRLYFEHHFDYQKFTGSHIKARISFIVMLKHFLEYNKLYFVGEPAFPLTDIISWVAHSTIIFINSSCVV